MVDTISNKLEFADLISRIKTKPNINKLVEWLELKTDYFYAPASTKYHNAVEGGLLDHSLKVTKMALGIYEQYQKLASVPIRDLEESIIICGLFHDICKVNYYRKTTKRRQVDGVWGDYETWEVNDTFPLGHGEKSIYMLNNFIKLTGIELLAIRWHMGRFEAGAAIDGDINRSLTKATESHPLVSIIQSADNLAAFTLEER